MPLSPPPTLLDDLNLVHNVRDVEARRGGRKARLWDRTSAWRKIKAVMDAADAKPGPAQGILVAVLCWNGPPRRRSS